MKYARGGMTSLDYLIEIQRLENELKKYEWVSVKDRLPETSGRYFVYTENIAGYKPLKNREFIAEFFWGEWIFTGWEYNRVTHWMPLPQPPKEDVDDT